MSEFDANGFSALDKFFGGEPQSENGGIERKGQNHQTRKRQGVGSSTPLKANQNDLTKRLLMVGRKRQRTDDDGDDDEDQDEVGRKGKIRGGSEDEEDDEETGRTTIAKSKSTKDTSPVDRLTTDAVSKKKLGKKERKKLNHNESDKKTLTDEKTDRVKDNDLSVKPTTETNETMTRGKDMPSSVDEENTQKKPKRRKVRSKQKNIRKDNRDKKPDHLIVGRKQYQGRPITAETRAKLNLPPPKARLSQNFGDPNPLHEQEDVQGSGLAIDDLLDDTGNLIETKKVKVSEKDSKKRRKTKYKNLKL